MSILGVANELPRASGQGRGTSPATAGRSIDGRRSPDGDWRAPAGTQDDPESTSGAVVQLSPEARAWLRTLNHERSGVRDDAASPLASDAPTDDTGATTPDVATAATPPDATGASDQTAKATGDESQAGRAAAQSKKPDTSGVERELTPQQQRQVAELKARDTEVRTHEAAHAAAAGGLGGAPSLEFATGPDGKRYAVNGEVSIDTSPGRTPEETIAKAQTIRAAATAPANPSGQDMAVAASAARMEAAARAAIAARTDDGREPGAVKSWRPAEPDEKKTDATGAGEADADPELMLAQLAHERSSARTGSVHDHSQGPCGTCRRAISAYAT